MTPESAHTKPVYDITPGRLVSDELLSQCSRLFDENYAVWAPHSQSVSQKLVPGARVKLPPARLRAECLSNPERTVIVTCRVNDISIGHVFATTWDCGNEVVGWVTQLVVDRRWRRQNIATTLLQSLKRHESFKGVSMLGIASSHPASCSALAKMARVHLKQVDLDFIAHNAHQVLASSSVRYIRTATLSGSLFDEHCTTGSVSTVDTQYAIDHTVPLEVLQTYMNKGIWKLGALPENHEFFLLVPVPPEQRFL